MRGKRCRMEQKMVRCQSAARLYVAIHKDIDTHPHRRTEGVGCIEIFICRKVSDSCQDKERSGELLQFSLARTWVETCLCRILKNCHLHTQFSFNYAICNLRRRPRQLIVTWSILLHSQSAGWRSSGYPIGAWIFINFHNLCACELCNLSRVLIHLLLWSHVYLNINQKVAMAAQVNITHTSRIRKSCSI